MGLFDNAPYDYILNHDPRDRMKLMHFRHRTFNGLDLLYFVEFLQHYYTNVTSWSSLSAGTSSRKTPTWKVR